MTLPSRNTAVSCFMGQLIILYVFIGWIYITHQDQPDEPKIRALRRVQGVKARDLVDPLSGRPSTIDFFFPHVPKSERDVWSFIQCTGWHRNRSCQIDNFYIRVDEPVNGEASLNRYVVIPEDQFRRGTFRQVPYSGKALTSEDVELREDIIDTMIPVTEHTLLDWLSKGLSYDAKHWAYHDITILRFPSREAVQAWAKSVSGGVEFHRGVSVTFMLFWAHQIGHALYDVLYPAYVSLIRFGYFNEPVNIYPFALNDSLGRGHQYEDMMRVFAGRNYWRLDDFPINTMHRFERMVMGNKYMGHRNPQVNSAMPGSYSYENALYWFGQRLLSGYGFRDPSVAMDPDKTVVSEFGSGGCRGVITDNKRFTEEDRLMLMDIALRSQELFKCNITYLIWQDYTFEEQLELFANSDIYISSLGTGIVRSHLIRPGGVIVQLGYLEELGTPLRRHVSYRDVHFALGSPHLSTVVYPRKLLQLYETWQYQAVVHLIDEAVMLGRRGFAIPRPFELGLAPSTRDWLNFCKHDPEGCDEVVDQFNGVNREPRTWPCEDCAWVDYIGISPMWTPKGCREVDTGEHVTCRLSRGTYMSVSSPEHRAFDADCYAAKLPEMLLLKDRLLEEEAGRLGKTVDELTPEEATNAMLMAEPPECPLVMPDDIPLCDC
ncbi:hypothetical protein FOL47_005074 [Perkinsus chesapeaki]|uniref:Uncharacterized protein n=1 Tax=Perkinsus chesapeaki TaxID=330153 RepID=A0A7J6LZ02_PERCH|nr:hypothetical protein FOL47_005074 [Perkinsus chesapeaki]